MVHARLAAIILSVSVLLTYFPSINAPFHFDDSHSIQNNSSIWNWKNLPKFWVDASTSSHLPENRVYRPLTSSVNSICWWVGKGATWPFRALKLFFHALSCWLTFLILSALWRKLKGWPFSNQVTRLRVPWTTLEFTLDPSVLALISSLFFSVHPAISETILYISATSTLLCSAFYLMAYWFYLSLREQFRWHALILSLCCYFLSVMAKEEGITLPAIILLTEIFLTNRWDRRAMLRIAPFFVLGALCAFVLYKFYPREGAVSHGPILVWQYFITQWRAYLYYWGLWFWPSGLNADNVSFGFSTKLSEIPVILAAIGNLLVLGFGFRQLKKQPAILFGILWFYITISPASSVVVLAEPVNEHRTYLAYIGFVGSVFWLLFALAQRISNPQFMKLRLGWVLAFFFVCLWSGTQERNLVWQSSENLWADTLKKNPDSGRALNNLALVYMEQGKLWAAVELLDRCERSWTSYVNCSVNRGNALAALKQTQSAEEAFNRALGLNPSSVHVHYFYGRFLQDSKQDRVSARKHLEKADELTGFRHVEAKSRLAQIEVQSGELGRAHKHAQAILKLDPSNRSATQILENPR